MLRYAWIYIVAFVLAALRIAGHKSQTFQAVAHLFVGGLFTAAWWQYGETWADGGLWGQSAAVAPAMRKFYLAIGLSVIELACALWFRFMG
jgi:hypothetical protein